MMIVGDTIDAMRRASGQSWLTDPTLHKEARAAMEAAFDLLAGLPKDFHVKRGKDRPQKRKGL